MKTVLNMPKNMVGTIKDIQIKDSTKRRLLDIGLTKGSQIFYKGNAPLGDPILINFRGIDLALRKADAANIIIE